MVEQPRLPRTRQAPAPSMPFDKQSNGKPITPALSSNFRNTKSPLTPRLAGSAPNSPASTPKREVLNRNRSPARDDGATGPLGGNVTPRTAARRSRIGTESPATPGSTKPSSTTRPRAVSGATAKQSGLGITNNARITPHVPNLDPSIKSPTPVYTVHRRISGAKSAVVAQDDDSKFIHAADARSSTSERPPPPSDASSFFFLGSADAQRTQSPKASPSVEPHASIDEKFFHASDVRPHSGPKPPTRPQMPARNGPPTAPARIPQLETTKYLASTNHTQAPNRTYPPAGHPSSPQKDSGRKGLSPADPARQNVDRRGSIGSNASNTKTNLRNGHRKSMSTSSINVSPPRKPASPSLAPSTTLDQRLASPLNASTLSLDRSVLSLPESLSTHRQPYPAHNSVPDLQLTSQPTIASPGLDPTIASPVSPTPIEHSQTSPAKPSHDATNARRERKVLDLEISNSSLLAINKTLERELRKQSVELRRFRRLSRSGRLSIAPTARSISSSTLDTVAEADDNEMEATEPEDDSDIDTLDDETDILSNDSSSISSPTSRTRQRARDEKRLMLDLSKHQQMLLDSQRLTQSIRRCLTCSEELIRDGNKALESKVGIGDVQLGGGC